MLLIKRSAIWCSLLLLVLSSDAQKQPYTELYRQQIHFSPKEKWINDPNGMFYFNGEYHLFFQFNPDSTVWGPMHWGHAVSRDLVHWEQLPIALYPDSAGTIFSGSAVVDSNNTSGFGTDGKIPLVAIFTQQNEKAAKAGTSDFQNQGIAYSLDNGRSWIKYTGNPVLKTPGLRDFRDPKVSWYAESKKWIMTLAAGDRLIFYSSPDLKTWQKESEFGKGLAAHGGVWECPDLLAFMVEGKKQWVVLVNVNGGGPQGGTGTRYFTGSFDGHQFVNTDTVTRWLDYGSDNYAGVTWSNTGSRKIFMGWMSNWDYADKVPSTGWRGAMTLPRELNLKLVNGKYYLSMFPVYELHKLDKNSVEFKNVPVDKLTNPPYAGKLGGSFRIDITAEILQSFSFVFSNSKDEQMVVGYDSLMRQFYIDRSRAGKTDFYKSFGLKQVAPRLSKKQSFSLTFILDAGSIELFADDGLTCMTDIFFLSQPFNHFLMKSEEGFVATTFRITTLNSIWR
jgi:fructan beta-fructosidase